MRRTLSQCLALALLATPTALRADDAPKGEVTKYTFDTSKVFPGTFRDYWVYVPKQYDGKTPACVYVNQDGIQFNAPAVFDKLIAREGDAGDDRRVRHARPGQGAPTEGALDRFNRSYEYDGLGDAYARFLLDELLPEVETKTTQRRPADQAVEERQRPRHRRRQQRGDLRVHRRVGAAGRLHPRVQRHRHLRRPARRQRLPDADPQVRAEADPRLPRRTAATT